MGVYPMKSRDQAVVSLANVDARIASFPDDPTAVPTRELHQEWASVALIALLGIGHALLDLADATRAQTDELHDQFMQSPVT